MTGFAQVGLGSLGHFVLAMASAVVARGLDMDQFRSRSAVSEAGGVVHDVLMFPHDVFMRALDHAWMARNLWVVPLALVLNSVLWGVAAWLAWRAVGRRRLAGRAARL